MRSAAIKKARRAINAASRTNAEEEAVVKVGLIPINVGVSDPELIVAIAQKAEAVGLESIWTYEHAVVPADYASRYPYSRSGKMPATTPETNFVDPLIALTFVAAHTKTLRLATGVNILPQANPLMAAKQVAALDVLSKGRFMYGVGAGWLEEEFKAMGVPFEKRGARFDDYLVAMKKVWSGDLVEHESERIHWSGWKSYPLPVQRPHPPLIIGGSGDAAFRRVVQHGNGWFAPTAGPAQLAELLGKLRAEAAKVGRDFATIEITATWFYAGEGVDSIAAYRDLGVSRLVAPLYGLGAPVMEGLEKLGNDLARIA